jgi:hypothetical protein
MLKHIIPAIALFSSCNNTPQQDATTKNDTAVARDHTISRETSKPLNDSVAGIENKVYSNQRFKDVTVEKIAKDSFRITGKAQVFEATLSWVVEDGHEELKKGFATADAGAPAWGKFSFVVAIPKKRSDSALRLILFETSAKDGSRQFELPVLLY